MRQFVSGEGTVANAFEVTAQLRTLIELPDLVVGGKMLGEMV